MRVLQILQKPQRRGAETFAVELAGWLRRDGHGSRVVALYSHDGPQLPLEADDVQLSGKEHGRREAALDPLLLAGLVQALRGFRPDVVQANGGRSLKYAPLARRLGAPNALWVYRNIDSPRFWLKRPLTRTLMPPLVRAGFDAAVGVSEATLREVHALYGFQGRSIAIENGVDFKRLAPGRPRAESRAVLADGDVRLIWVGALGAQKRPDRALEVLARLPSNVSLTLVGEGPWRAKVEAQTEALGLGERVRLLGNRADVGDLMAAADIFLMTSDTEGIPAVIIEAAHCGLPIVTVDVGGLRECVRDGETGVIVPAGDVGALVSAVRGLVDNASQCQAFGAAGKVFSTRFGMDVIGPRYLAFYREQLARLGRHPR